jgi:hypothetical protein
VKFLAAVQIVCIVFLSSFQGMIKPAAPVAKINCCHKTAKTSFCHNKSADQKDGCKDEGCNMILSCSLCGFLITETVTIKQVPLAPIAKPVLIYKIGNLSGYATSDWKPPKV